MFLQHLGQLSFFVFVALVFSLTIVSCFFYLFCCSLLFRTIPFTTVLSVSSFVSSIGSGAGERIGSLDTQLGEQTVSLAELDTLVTADASSATPLGDLDSKIANLQSQITALTETSHSKNPSMTNMSN